jgi:hypothetical protein
MDIYSILASKPHNPHYLHKYITFIEKCQLSKQEGYLEIHHICPKAKDMFPEYKSFKENPWNKIALTARQHFIAHLFLWKSYPHSKSCFEAIWSMKHQNKIKVNSRIYESMKIKHSDKMKKLNELLIKNGEHIFQSPEFQRKNANKRIENGTHNFLGDENPSVIKMKEGTHIFIGDTNPNNKRLEDGTHHFLSSEYQSNLQRRRVENGTHNLLGGELQRRMVKEGKNPLLGGKVQKEHQNKLIAEGNHNFKNKIPCRDKRGNMVIVNKDIYDREIHLPLHEREYVHVNSKEAKIRLRAFSL